MTRSANLAAFGKTIDGVGSQTLASNLNFTGTNVYFSTPAYHAANLVLSSTVGVSANGGFGSNGQALTTNGSAVYWSTIVGVNTAAQYTFTNTISFTNTLTVNTVLHNNPFLLNGLTVNTSYSIPSGYSAVSAGPITLANGVTVTIPSGSKWVVL